MAMGTAAAGPPFVGVALDLPVDRLFTYRVPEHLRERVGIGSEGDERTVLADAGFDRAFDGPEHLVDQERVQIEEGQLLRRLHPAGLLRDGR